MAAERRSALTTVAAGLGAGAVGTLAMTGWQELSSRLMSNGSDSSSEDTPSDPWEQASVPAQVARKLANVVGIDPDPKRIPLLTNLMHWSYGTGWGPVYALLPKRRGNGLLFGAGVWLMSYVQLVPLGLYEPPWKYPLSQLGLDLSYHLVYGAGTEAGDALITRASQGR
jgi:uncharacterized membrane protein YagU involved in acid resistance